MRRSGEEGLKETWDHSQENAEVSQAKGIRERRQELLLRHVPRSILPDPDEDT